MNSFVHQPNRWLAFEASVLRKLDFASIALARAGHSGGALQIKRRGALVLANENRPAYFHELRATLDNANETLTSEEVDALLLDVYAPGFNLNCPRLLSFFSVPEAWWFDNLHRRIKALASPIKQSIALAIAVKTGEYALSFTDETRELRQPLSTVFRRLAHRFPAPFDNRQANVTTQHTAREFIATVHADLLFLRLPRRACFAESIEKTWHDSWLEETVDEETVEADEARESEVREAKAATSTTSSPGFNFTNGKTSFLRDTEDLFARSLHFPRIALAHTADGYLSVEELADTVRAVRAVEAIYTKDFSEFSGSRAAIIIA